MAADTLRRATADEAATGERPTDTHRQVKTQEYRNKLDFGCANKRYLTSEELKDQSLEKNIPAIGFHITGAFDKILPIEKCWLMDDLHNRIRNEARDYAARHGLSFFDLRQQVGLLRDIIIRNSNSGEWMVIVQFHYDETGGEPEAMGLMQHLADTFPQITSLLYLDNQKCNDTIGDQDIMVFRGKDHIISLPSWLGLEEKLLEEFPTAGEFPARGWTVGGGTPATGIQAWRTVRSGHCGERSFLFR